MDLNHGLLILLIVLGFDGSGGSNLVDDLVEFIHLGPVSCVEPVHIPQVDVRAVCH